MAASQMLCRRHRERGEAEHGKTQSEKHKIGRHDKPPELGDAEILAKSGVKPRYRFRGVTIKSA